MLLEVLVLKASSFEARASGWHALSPRRAWSLRSVPARSVPATLRDAITVTDGRLVVNLAQHFYLFSNTTVAVGQSDKGYPGCRHGGGGKNFHRVFDAPAIMFYIERGCDSGPAMRSY